MKEKLAALVGPELLPYTTIDADSSVEIQTVMKTRVHEGKKRDEIAIDVPYVEG